MLASENLLIPNYMQYKSCLLYTSKLTWQKFDWLMSGLEIEQPKAFKPTQ